ncbi:MAG: hypothetical protein ACLFR2_06650 [Candidatus Kapaibacterium sp.]
MKKLIVIMLILGGFTAYATSPGHNGTVDGGPCTMTTECIAPFQVYNVQPSQPDALPDVIKGQTWTGSVMMAIFEMTKEETRKVRFNVHFDNNPVDGVLLGGRWEFVIAPTGWTGGWPIGTTAFNWNPGSTLCQVGFLVESIDATSATTTGVRSFNVSISGKYINL